MIKPQERALEACLQYAIIWYVKENQEQTFRKRNLKCVAGSEMASQIPSKRINWLSMNKNMY